MNANSAPSVHQTFLSRLVLLVVLAFTPWTSEAATLRPLGYPDIRSDNNGAQWTYPRLRIQPAPGELIKDLHICIESADPELESLLEFIDQPENWHTNITQINGKTCLNFYADTTGTAITDTNWEDQREFQYRFKINEMVNGKRVKTKLKQGKPTCFVTKDGDDSINDGVAPNQQRSPTEYVTPPVGPVLTAAMGRCDLPNAGGCVPATAQACDVEGGTFSIGECTTGACVFPDSISVCVDMSEAMCSLMGGGHQGDGTTCSTPPLVWGYPHPRKNKGQKVYSGLVAEGISSAAIERNASTPMLGQNWPNPFSTETSIQFMTTGGHAKIEVVTLTGRRVNLLFDGSVDPGLYELPWNGKDSSGTRLSAGIYFYRLVTDQGVLTRKLLLLP